MYVHICTHVCTHVRTYVCDIFKINITLRTAVCARFDVDGDCGVIGWYAARSVRCTLSSLSISLSCVPPAVRVVWGPAPAAVQTTRRP